MATQSAGAKLRETVAGVVAVGAAVSDEAKKIKAEAADRANEVLKAGENGGGSAGVQPGA